MKIKMTLPRLITTLLIGSSLLGGCGTTTNAPTDDKAELKTQTENAKRITQVFAETLKGELQAAIKEGGPVNALTVCRGKAIPITGNVAKEQGVQLSRVSLKNRNPKNMPNDWQKIVLKDFDARAVNGEDVKTMAYSEIIKENGKQEFRFMKALPTGGICLTCHGSDLPSDVTTKLSELYPQDKATGYQMGQVRGAIVIVKKID